jgi:formylglycine-generating enzyme required for sulfatase activity
MCQRCIIPGVWFGHAKAIDAQVVASTPRSLTAGGCSRQRVRGAVCILLLLLCPIPVFIAEVLPVQAQSPGLPYFAQSIPGSTVSFEMVGIPGGEITIGSPPNETGRDHNDASQTKVKVRSFWLGKHEVTWREYLLYAHLDDSEIASVQPGTRVPIDRDGITHPSRFYGAADRGRGDGKYPAIGMGCIAASEYCRWLAKKTGKPFRLPTEAEWEYSCRAGATTAFFWSNDATRAPEYAWFKDNSAQGDFSETTHPVGKLKSNGFGLHDITGNVAEWCAMLENGGPHVVRGGGFSSAVTQLRCAARMIETPEWDELDPELPHSPWWLTADFVGFRVALDNEAAPANPRPVASKESGQ